MPTQGDQSPVRPQPAPSAGPHPTSSRDVPFARPVYKIERILRVVHSFNYRYVQPVRDVATRLCLLPPPARGTQRLQRSGLYFAPLPTASYRHQDGFGNEVVDVRHEKVWQHLTAVVELEVRNEALYRAEGQVLPAGLVPTGDVSPERTASYDVPTALTQPDADLQAVATHVGIDDDAPRRAFALCQHVYREMRYRPGTTTVQTKAAEAWASRQGVCQDYAHILLALCRLTGFAARYVSGFLPGEGAMHAWVEVLLPGTGEEASVEAAVPAGGWVGLDPTHDRWVNERYVAIAVGRDYADITPTSGTFIGVGPGVLSHQSKVLVARTVRTALEP